MDQLNLTEQEKREIARLVAENKPLPDKYRFLLFQDKKQVELVSVELRQWMNQGRNNLPTKNPAMKERNLVFLMSGVVKLLAGPTN